MALTQEQVVGAALAVADREGPDALGMRRVARELGVTPMALYRYVASKDELLDLVRDSLWQRLDVQTRNEVAWRNALRGIARGFRQLVGDHPAAPILLATGSGEGRAERRICDAMLASFRSAGFDSETAEVLYQQFSHFVLALVRLDSVERQEGKDGKDGFELGVELFLGGVAALRSKR